MTKQQLISKLKTFLNKKDNLLILVLTGILLLVIAWPVEKSGSSVDKSTTGGRGGKPVAGESITTTIDTTAIGKNPGNDTTVAALEHRLEALLSLVQGVGKVKVMITLEASAETIVEKDSPTRRNNVVENDSQGGSRSTNEMDAEEVTVYVINEAGEKVPYVTKSISPVIGGVSVVAEGGNNPQVQKNVTEMIQALFDLPVHKIKIAKMKEQS